MTTLKVSSTYKIRGETPVRFTNRLAETIPAGRYKLEQAVIPNAWFNVTSSNNRVYFRHGSSANLDGNYIRRPAIPPGVYSPSSLAPVLADAMSRSISGNTGLLEVTYDPLTRGFIFRGTTFTANFMQFMWGEMTEDSAHALLGFDQKDGVIADEIRSDNPVDLSHSLSLHIRLDPFHSQAQDSDGAIGFTVPVTGNSGSIMTMTSHDYGRQEVRLERPTNIVRVELRGDGGPLEGMHSDWFIVLRRVGS